MTLTSSDIARIFELFRVLLAVDDALEEERAAVRVMACEFVNVSIAEGCPMRRMIEHDGRQRLIDVQASNFAKAREAGDGDVLERREARDFVRVAEAAQDAVVEDAADGLRLFLAEFGNRRRERARERRAAQQVERFARDDVAEEVDAVIGLVDVRNRADKVRACNIGCERVVLELFLEFGRRRGAELVLERGDEGDWLAVRAFDRADVAQRRVRAEDVERRACALDGLRLEDAIAVVMREAHDRDNGLVLDRLLAVVDVRVLEIELAACAAADERAGEEAGFIEALQHERLAVREAVNVDECERVVHADAERRLVLADFGGDDFRALGDAHLDAAFTQVVVRQGDAHRIDILNHAARERFEQHHAAAVGIARFLIERAFGGMAELARRREQDELCVRGQCGLDFRGDCVKREVGRDEAEHERGAISHVRCLLDAGRVEFARAEVGDGDVFLRAGLRCGSCRRRSSLCALHDEWLSLL